MIVLLSNQAESDLEEICDHIAADNPKRAVSFVQELVSRCENLAEVPRAFPLVPRYEHTGVRRLPHGNYLIFYRITDDQVHVLHILNGAQDYETLLFADN